MGDKKTDGKPKKDVADAVVEMIHAGQSLRKAARGQAVHAAQKAVGGVAKVVDALGDL